jgi:hypothetical protein
VQKLVFPLIPETSNRTFKVQSQTRTHPNVCAHKASGPLLSKIKSRNSIMKPYIINFILATFYHAIFSRTNEKLFLLNFPIKRRVELTSDINHHVIYCIGIDIIDKKTPSSRTLSLLSKCDVYNWRSSELASEKISLSPR